MNTIYLPNPEAAKYLDTEEMRDNFLLENLFAPGEINMTYTDLDRLICGGAMPGSSALILETGPELAADYFLERRELGILNIGSAGKVIVDGKTYDLDKRDALYVGKGVKEVSFQSDNPNDPAVFYLASYPAHAVYPTTKISQAEAEREDLGSQSNANVRSIFKYIHPNGAKSAQLVLGFTEIQDGSVWNTMPCHRHPRRMEVYFYFDLPEDGAVFHLMGEPDETRHLVVRNREAVLSPSWSIHSGVCTGAYRFIWAMGGENQAFADMDFVPMSELR